MTHPKQAAQRGIALLEAMIASLILAIGLIGALGLQARAYSAISDATMRSEATLAAESLFGIRSSDQANLSTYALAAGATPSASLTAWHARVQRDIPGAAVVIRVTAPTAPSTMSTVNVTISWTRRQGGATGTHTVTTYIAPST
jgi:type IV pilus assembly protein PilV